LKEILNFAVVRLENE